MTLVALNPSQVRYPWKAVLRTLIQIVITGATVVPWLNSALQDASDGSSFAPQLTAAGAQVLVVAGIITRFMAMPGINEALTKWGLGARPAGAPPVILAQDAPVVDVVTTDPVPAPVIPDPPLDAPGASERPYGRHAKLD